MQPEHYSPEQRKDIEYRVKKVQDLMKELDLQPSVIIQAVNVGDDTFAMKAIPYLQDIKYKNVVSPIQEV